MSDAYLKSKIFDLEDCAISSRHVLLTRFGIGISDECWIDFRLKIFKAITLPSVVNQSENYSEWLIFIDVAWPESKKHEILEIISNFKFIKIIELDFYFQFNICVEKIVKNSIDDFGCCLASKIDDDDAFSLNVFELLYSVKEDFFIYTFANGCEFLPQERLLRQVNIPFLTMNTHFYLTTYSELDYLKLGHHRVRDFAIKNGRKIIINDQTQNSWIYSRHKQSDSRFPAVRKNIMEDSSVRIINAKDYKMYGIDFDCLQEFRRYSMTVGGSPNEKTWLLQSDLDSNARILYLKLREIKEKIKQQGGSVISRKVLK